MIKGFTFHFISCCSGSDNSSNIRADELLSKTLNSIDSTSPFISWQVNFDIFSNSTNSWGRHLLLQEKLSIKSLKSSVKSILANISNSITCVECWHLKLSTKLQDILYNQMIDHIPKKKIRTFYQHLLRNINAYHGPYQ